MLWMANLLSGYCYYYCFSNVSRNQHLSIENEWCSATLPLQVIVNAGCCLMTVH